MVFARARAGQYWRLLEPWSDQVKPLRRVVESYINPILDEALAKKKNEKPAGPTDDKVVEEGENLLDHLVQYTQGVYYSNLVPVALKLILGADYKILQDELINILVAARDTVSSSLTYSPAFAHARHRRLRH